MSNLISKIKSYFFENKNIIRKFWVNQFAASILGIMVTWPVRIYSEKNPSAGSLPTLAALLFCGGFFCFLIYDVIHQEGLKDHLRIINHKEPYDPYKAIRLVMFAYIPTVFLTLLATLFFVFGFGTGYGAISLLMNTAVHGMYVGLFFLLPTNISALAFPISIFITAAFACLAYFLGVRNKTLRSFFGIRTNSKKE